MKPAVRRARTPSGVPVLPPGRADLILGWPSRGKLPGRRQPRPHPGALITGETGPCHNDLPLFNALEDQPLKEAETCFMGASAVRAALSFSTPRFRANSAGPGRRGIVLPPRPTWGAAPGQKKRPCVMQGQCYPYHKDIGDAASFTGRIGGCGIIFFRYHS